MIIKSMSRKRASFSQLVGYMNKESASPHVIGHNIYLHERSTQADIIHEFETNAENLPKRKNGNYLYHEIISFESNELSKEVMDEIIIEIGELYVSERAPSQLAYGVIHRDTDIPHIHFCISANNLGEATRKRLSKKQFSQIQKNLEHYVQEKFPELEERAIYGKERDLETTKTSSREQALKKRSGRASKKDILKNKLHGLFELSNTHKELEQQLEKEGYYIYTRGKNVGIEHRQTGRKHRFTTLGVIEHYLSALERYNSFEIAKRQQTQHREPLPESKEEKEAQQSQSREDITQEQASVKGMKEADNQEQEAERYREAQQREQEELMEQARKQAEASYDEKAAEAALAKDRERWAAAEKHKQARKWQSRPRPEQRNAYEAEQRSREEKKSAPLQEHRKEKQHTHEKAATQPQQKTRTHKQDTGAHEKSASRASKEKKTVQSQQKDYAHSKQRTPLKEKAKDFVANRIAELDRLVRNKDKDKER